MCISLPTRAAWQHMPYRKHACYLLDVAESCPSAPQSTIIIKDALYDQSMCCFPAVITGNFADSVVRVPAETQTCSQPTFPFLGSYNYTHIGKSILLCPYAVGLNLFDRNLGLVKWVLNATGTEGLDCDPLISGVPVLSPTPLTTPGRTHWLGPHLDAWRRGVTFATGNNLATSPQIANTICAECGAQFLNIDKQINQPARAGGPVACSDLITSSDCKKRKAYEAAASVGNTETKPYNSLSFCLGYLCT